MRQIFAIFSIFVLFSCQRNEKKRMLDAQAIVDSSIAVSGGDLYTSENIAFRFREIDYAMRQSPGKRVLERKIATDTGIIVDRRTNNSFTRLLEGVGVPVSDSMARVYSNSINSVHYFAYLPFGLNDPAVNKKLLGEVSMKGQGYYKVRITFDREGGGDDFDDIYYYWFNKKTLKPDYLAYSFHVNGGGQRFRVAYNERYRSGIRFVDYENYKNADTIVPLVKIDSLYMADKLELLSKIVLEDIVITPGSYN